MSEQISRDYTIAAVDRALDVVEVLARIGPASLAAVAMAAGCTRTAGFRLLRTLEARGFAVQESSRGSWRLGSRWNVLAGPLLDGDFGPLGGGDILNGLAARLGENVYVLTRVGQEARVTSVATAEMGLRVFAEPGKTLPLHVGPARLLLAYAPDELQERVLGKRLARHTADTKTDVGWLRAESPRVRARGWLVTAGEAAEGSVTVSIPLPGVDGRVISALTIWSPEIRLRTKEARDLVPDLQRAAAEIEAARGARDMIGLGTESAIYAVSG